MVSRIILNEMQPIDAYRDTFLKFLADGMTHAEALEQFDEKEWSAAALMEIESEEGLTRIDPHSLELVTNDSRALPSLLSLGSLADFQRRKTDQAYNAMMRGV